MRNANEELQQFTGTEMYYAHFIPNHYYTDGIHAAAEKFECFWLIDLVFSWQLKKELQQEEFQVWNLKRIKDCKFLATCDDGNGNILAQQKIPFSDFPCDEIKLYLENKVLLLPSEH